MMLMGSSNINRVVHIVMSLAMIAGLGGWLCMWFTEEAIWAPQAKHCTAYATIELKGRVYQTCSYLAARYRAGETTFEISWLLIAISIVTGRLHSGGWQMRKQSK